MVKLPWWSVVLPVITLYPESSIFKEGDITVTFVTEAFLVFICGFGCDSTWDNDNLHLKQGETLLTQS